MSFEIVLINKFRIGRCIRYNTYEASPNKIKRCGTFALLAISKLVEKNMKNAVITP
jgi:hypothetical protein